MEESQWSKQNHMAQKFFNTDEANKLYQITDSRSSMNPRVKSMETTLKPILV